MVVFDNLARILQDNLQSSNVSNVSLEQWKLLGQEEQGRLVVSWLEKNQDASCMSTCIGIYHPTANSLQILCRIDDAPNIIQASVNSRLTLVSYTVKATKESTEIYQHCVKFSNGIDISGPKTSRPELVGIQGCRQIMSTFINGSSNDVFKLLLLIHLESIILQKIKKEGVEKLVVIKEDAIAKAFAWAQWDCDVQALYFIHFKKTFGSIEGDDAMAKVEDSPTLSCFQFHQDLPHETVLNVPLNLPSIPKSTGVLCHKYEDDPLPLRIHDCSLDLIVVSDGKGIICICHHYLYEPAKTAPAEDLADDQTVHFAYSVTLLHHGSVIHIAVPGIPWTSAKTMKPVFALLGDQYLVVYAAKLFTHLLDIGLNHEPNCHILMNGTLSAVPVTASRLVALNADFSDDLHLKKYSTDLRPIVMIDINTMDLIEFEVEVNDLMSCLINEDCISNRLSILHYFLVHSQDFESVEEVLSILCSNPTDINLPTFFKEVLVGGTYSLTPDINSFDTNSLLDLLPITSLKVLKCTERKINQITCMIRQEILWNTAVMLLSPQQRLKPFITDIWRKIWERLIKPMKNSRWKLNMAEEKLFASSNCRKPRSPSWSDDLSISVPEQEVLKDERHGGMNDDDDRKNVGFNLPFVEIDYFPNNQQEHVMSVNLRELSLHLLKNCLEESPANLDSVATRYVSAQLKMSKFLCHILGKLAGVDVTKTEKGFSLIKAMHSRQRSLLFMYYQRFFNAINDLAYPLPLGFSSFFSYLGFTCLPFQCFMMYLRNNVFQLQMDVMKEIMKDTEDTSEGVTKKLNLLLLLPRHQAKQLLNDWPHGISIMIRAREHALNLLSGVQSSHCQGLLQMKRPLPNTKGHHRFLFWRGLTIKKGTFFISGLAAFPSANGLSPLDTFLDLLTAKASLADLDFNLLIDATISSTQDSF